MKGLIILFFHWKKRITEQVRNEDAQGTGSWYPNNLRYQPDFIWRSSLDYCENPFNEFCPNNVQYAHLCHLPRNKKGVFPVFY
jgi:hypothetical protein